MTKILQLALDRMNTPRLDLDNFESNTAYAQYSIFGIGDDLTKYTLNVEGYNGTAGDGLITHSIQIFLTQWYEVSTKDKDNDNHSYGGSCATDFKEA